MPILSPIENFIVSLMYKFLTKIAAFFLLIIVLLQVFNQTLPSYWGNEVIYKKMAQLGAETKVVNTVFIGTSRIHSHVNPKLYDSLVKKSYSFNIASPGAAGLETTRIVDQIINSSEEHNIRTIYSEIPSFNTPPKQNSQSVRAKYFYDFRSFRYNIQFIFNKPISLWEKCQMVPHALKVYLENLLNLGLLRSAITTGYDYHFGKKNIERTPRRGFNELKKTIKKFGPVKSRLHQAQNFYTADKEGEQNTEYPFLTKTLLENIAKAETKGIRLIYVLLPKVPIKKYQENYYTLINLPAKNALNLSHPKEYPAFYKQENSADKAHLNFKGAKLLTQLLAEHTNEFSRP